MKKIDIIENFINIHSFGKVKNALLTHLEHVKKVKNIDIEQLTILYVDYLKTFIATEEMRSNLLEKFKNV